MGMVGRLAREMMGSCKRGGWRWMWTRRQWVDVNKGDVTVLGNNVGGQEGGAENEGDRGGHK